MIIVIAMLFVGMLAMGLFMAFLLRRWIREEERLEAALHSPQVHTVSYVVPVGQDAAVLMAALALEGYASVTDTGGGTERLMVACEDHDRAQVRRILEHVDRAGFDGPEIHVGHVHFEDDG
jgi:hypothetical protein